MFLVDSLLSDLMFKDFVATGSDMLARCNSSGLISTTRSAQTLILAQELLSLVTD